MSSSFFAANRRALALGLGIAAITPAAFGGITVPLGDGTGLAAEAEFTLVHPHKLVVRLRNTSTGLPDGFDREDQIITSVSFDLGEPGWAFHDPFIIGGDVVIGPESHSLEFDTGEYGPGDDVGGEWGFGNFDHSGPLQNFITAVGDLVWRFHGENLDGPYRLDGPQGGVVPDPVVLPLEGVGAIQTEIVATLYLSRAVEDLSFLEDHGVAVAFGGDTAVLFAEGGFVYRPPTKITALQFPTALATGDIDGASPLDGTSTQDLIVAVITETGEPGELFVMLNDGSGLEYEQVSTSVGVDPSDVVVVDLDGVNGLDVAVVNNGDDTVTVLLNDGLGEGTFLPGVTIDVGTLPGAIDASDVNGDGAPDLAVANQGDGTVWILFNDGDGGFGAPNQILETTDAPIDVSLQPLDKDGFVDLAVITAGAEPTFEVFINDGEGEFFPPEGASVVLAALPGELEPSDLDNDKDIDYLTTDEDDGSVMLLLNDGDGMFSGQTIPVGEAPSSISTDDLDGDGDVDFLVVAGNGEPGPTGDRVVKAFRNELNETGKLGFSEAGQFDPDPFLSIVRTDTLNDDGVPDIATLDAEDGGAPEGSLSVLLGVGGCPGDVNFTGLVDMADLMQLLADWGPCAEPCPPTCTSDIDGDCMVSTEDLLLMLASWGPC